MKKLIIGIFDHFIQPDIAVTSQVNAIRTKYIAYASTLKVGHNYILWCIV